MNDQFISIVGQIAKGGFINSEELGEIVDNGFIDTDLIIRVARSGYKYEDGEIEFLLVTYRTRNCLQLKPEQLKEVNEHWHKFEDALHRYNSFALNSAESEFSFVVNVPSEFGGNLNLVNLALFAQTHGWAKVCQKNNKAHEFTFVTREISF
jgi:hypothetical protein